MNDNLKSLVTGICIGAALFAVDSKSPGNADQVVKLPIESHFLPIPLFDDPAPQPEYEREEVIESDVSPESTILVDDEPEVSLPPGPARQATLGDEFSSIEDFMNCGSPGRLVVFSADWCAPCRTYKQRLARYQVSESFDAQVQVIDVDKYPALYAKLRGQNLIPQTLYLGDSGTVTRVYGEQSDAWLRGRVK